MGLTGCRLYAWERGLGSATEKLPVSCPFCPPNDYPRRGSGNALPGSHASKTPIFSGVSRVCRGGWWEFLDSAWTLQHSSLCCQPFPIAPRSPQPTGCSPPLLTCSLKMSLSLPLEPNGIICSYYLGFGTESICFTPQLISGDKRSHQQIKTELLCGGAEAYTQAASQADLYLIWSSFAILIFRNKNGLIALKKKKLRHAKLLAITAAMPALVFSKGTVKAG